VRWELARDEGFNDIAARGTETAVLDEAHSVHAEPGALEPGRRYWYRFEALGQRSAVGRTRTAPAADANAAARFALASCQRWDHGHFAAWRHVAAAELDFVLFVGDYIYEYASPPTAPRRHDGGLVRTLEQYRARYTQYKSDASLQAAHAALPWLMVWDDHEVDNDYADLQGQSLQPDFRAQRAAAYRAYWEHMPFPKVLRPAGPDMRIYGRYDWGAWACIHAVDDRQYRDVQVCPRPDRGGSNTVKLRDCPALLDPKRTLLGATQGTLARAELGPETPLEPAGAADADGAFVVDRHARCHLLDRWLGRLRPGTQSPARCGGRAQGARGGGARRRRACQLCGRPEARLRRPACADRGHRVLRHLDHEPAHRNRTGGG